MAKALSQRIVATLTMMLLVFVFTGNLIMSCGVRLTVLLSEFFIYNVHQHIWNAIGFGRVKKPNE